MKIHSNKPPLPPPYTVSPASQHPLDGNFSLEFWADQALKDDRCSVPYAHGRPDLRAEIKRVSDSGMKALVFVCSVPPVAKAVAQLTQEYGVDFHTETFYL